MRNGWVWLFLIAVGCAAGGCTRGHGAFFSGQEEIESVAQWNVLANHVADRINKELMRQQYVHASVHVRHSCGTPGRCGADGTFPFDEGFNDLLTTQLVNFGVNIVTSPENADLTVEYKVQAVYHPPDRRRWDWPEPGVLTVLAAGIVVIEDAPWELIAGAAAVDVVRANDQPSGQYEVIITTSILDGKRYVMRSSDIYCINGADYWHYHQDGPAAEIRLTGTNAAPRPVPTTKTSL